MWWGIAIGGCVGLAICISAAMRPTNVDRRLRLLANVERLTRLPEYRRAVRLRTTSVVVAIALLVTIFSASVLTASRPTGLPSATQRLDAAQPEDIMLCVGGPPTDRAVGATLRYFAEQVKTFTSQRIGLTSSGQRIVPLTRDYQYAAAQFSQFGTASEHPDDDFGWAPAVSYVDYAPDVADLLAMCLTGFPSFDQPSAQRRSIIYVGPGSLRAPGDTRRVLYTVDAVRDLAQTARIQINVVSADSDSETLDALARETGGRSRSGATGVGSQLSDIRQHPPAPTAAGDQATQVAATETPDLPVLLALAAIAGLTAWPLVVRRR